MAQNQPADVQSSQTLAITSNAQTLAMTAISSMPTISMITEIVNGTMTMKKASGSTTVKFATAPSSSAGSNSQAGNNQPISGLLNESETSARLKVIYLVFMCMIFWA
jgi:hypothetical protein